MTRNDPKKRVTLRMAYQTCVVPRKNVIGARDDDLPALHLAEFERRTAEAANDLIRSTQACSAAAASAMEVVSDADGNSWNAATPLRDLATFSKTQDGDVVGRRHR